MSRHAKLIQPCFQPIKDTITNSRLGYEATIKGRAGESAKVLFDRAMFRGKESVHDLDRHARLLALSEGEQILEDSDLLFLNVSSLDTLEREARQFLERGLAGRLVFEITEHVSIDQEAVRLIEKIHELGFMIAIDDFGKGSANWRSFVELPISYLKMDMYFVHQIHRAASRYVIEKMAELCLEMDIKLILEGVETEAQFQELLKLKGRYMQGFYFGRPQFIESNMRVHA
ncbi:EAL domain-containing protein [Cohnella soli]|uniref:EAL domain-containing protein n=1 Tax=Cohnella soli TaxID=425005 RepID=A0ABW0HR12_9BACL